MTHDPVVPPHNLAGTRIGGYRGIWFTLGQPLEHGDKYSGGLGTYTANHLPMAVYAERANKTFFVYGGTAAADQRRLLCMASCYDHATGRVPRPMVVHDKMGVDDPHDNPSINLDADGHVWVFVSGRGRRRPGFKYRSVRPHDIGAFELVEEGEMTYPQVHRRADACGGGFLHLFTKYTAGRELYWQTSADGRAWTEGRKLAGFGGHYQVSATAGETTGSAFMYHPGGDVDRRTNLYYVQTRDGGRGWATASGAAIDGPLDAVDNPALVIDYARQGRNVYIHDLAFDAAGRPVILYLTSGGFEPGPASAPVIWHVTRWDGSAWRTADVTRSDHCYDTGSLYTDSTPWHIIGPTEPGPQPYATGGEVAVWASGDAGQTWAMHRRVTGGSRFNHSYVRRPLNARDPFGAFWADGDPGTLTPSRLYFCDRDGRRVHELPYDMADDEAEPGVVTS